MKELTTLEMINEILSNKTLKFVGRTKLTCKQGNEVKFLDSTKGIVWSDDERTMQLNDLVVNEYKWTRSAVTLEEAIENCRKTGQSYCKGKDEHIRIARSFNSIVMMEVEDLRVADSVSFEITGDGAMWIPID